MRYSATSAPKRFSDYLLTTGGLDLPETKGVRHAENY
jgi:hypothetical protein